MYFAAFGVRAIPSARDILVLLRVLVVLDKKVPLKFFIWIGSTPAAKSEQPKNPSKTRIPCHPLGGFS